MQTVHQFVDSSFLNQGVVPRRSIGILFLLEFATFIVFLVCLALRFQEQMVPQKSLLTESVISEVISFDASSLKTLEAVQAYLVESPLRLIGTASHDQKTTVLLKTHRLLGSAWIFQQRSPQFECFRESSVFECIGDASLSDYQAFEGALSRGVVQNTFATESCPSVLCDPGFRSSLSGTFYSSGGPTLFAFGGHLFQNSTAVFQNESDSSVITSFVDRFTRYVSLTGVLMDGEGKIVTLFAVNVELPIVGGAFAWLETRTVRMEHTFRNAQYAAVVWFYCAAFIAVSVIRSVMGIVNRGSCEACNSAAAGFCASTCSSCSKPICLDVQEATRCSWCGVSLQPLQHGCWRTQLDVTRVIPLLNIVTIIFASVCESQALSQLQERVGIFLSTPLIAGDAPVLDLFAATDQLDRVATMNAFNMLIAFVCMYRFLGRAPWIARFLRVFTSGGFLMAFFFVGFSAVFFGFMLSFHLLLGETTGTFATIPGAFAGTFQLLLGLLDWESVNASLYSRSFTALYLFFCWVCVLVMVNVLISLVTAEYKRSRKVKAFDLETESCKLLFARKSANSSKDSMNDAPATSAGCPTADDERREESRRVVEDFQLDADSTLPLIKSVRTNVDHINTSANALEDDAKSIRRACATINQVSALLRTVQ